MTIIRPARLADLPQIRDINGHYIFNTSLTFMQNLPPLEAYTTKFRDLQARSLPYLVAIDSAEKDQKGTATVLGYIYLSPFRGQLLSYAPTVELSLFVHPNHQSRSIGSSLLQTVLRSVQQGEILHRAHERTDDDQQPREGSADVLIRNILAIMAVDPEGQNGGEGLRRWYQQRGFVERGRMEKVGFKRGRW